MTRGNKILTWFVLEVGLLGGAFGAGYYLQRKPLDRCVTDKGKLAKENLALTARNQVMEATVGSLYGNYGYAFDRVVRARFAAQAAGLKLEDEFEDINALLISQNPAVRDKLLILAEKIVPMPFAPPSPKPGSPAGGKGGPPANAGAKGAAGGAGGAPGAGGTPGAGGAPGTSGAPGAGGAGGAPAAGVALAGGTPGGAAPSPGAAGAPASAVEAHPAGGAPPLAGPARAAAAGPLVEGRKALLDAKVSLLAGGEVTETAHKLAQARVMLDEGGHTEFDDELDGAIKALRAKDESRAKAAVETVLGRLRDL